MPSTLMISMVLAGLVRGESRLEAERRIDVEVPDAGKTAARRRKRIAHAQGKAIAAIDHDEAGIALVEADHGLRGRRIAVRSQAYRTGRGLAVDGYPCPRLRGEAEGSVPGEFQDAQMRRVQPPAWCRCPSPSRRGCCRHRANACRPGKASQRAWSIPSRARRAIPVSAFRMGSFRFGWGRLVVADSWLQAPTTSAARPREVASIIRFIESSASPQE